MNLRELFAQLFRRRQQYDFSEKNNAKTQKVILNSYTTKTNREIEKPNEFEAYKKYFSKPEIICTSKEEALDRLQQAQKKAQDLNETLYPENYDELSDTEKAVINQKFTSAMAEFYKDKFYLSDFFHYWLNQDVKVAQNFKKQRGTGAKQEGLVGTSEQYDEQVKMRYDRLCACLDGQLKNRKLNQDALKETVKRSNINHYIINEEVQKKYMEDLKTLKELGTGKRPSLVNVSNDVNTISQER